MQYASIIIAIFSLILSLFAVRLGRTNRGYDLLFKFYNDLRLREPEEVSSVDDIIPPEFDEIDEDERFIQEYNNHSKREHRESKFNLACYSVIKRQIPLEDFFVLFAGYLQSRMDLWPKMSSCQINDYPYTSQIIDKCIKKGLLPISSNNKYIRDRSGKLRHWEEGINALQETRSKIINPHHSKSDI